MIRSAAWPLASAARIFCIRFSSVLIFIVSEEKGHVRCTECYVTTTTTSVGIENVAMHVIEHDIVLTQDIIFDYKTTGKVSPVIKVKSV